MELEKDTVYEIETRQNISVDSGAADPNTGAGIDIMMPYWVWTHTLPRLTSAISVAQRMADKGELVRIAKVKREIVWASDNSPSGPQQICAQQEASDGEPQGRAGPVSQ